MSGRTIKILFVSKDGPLMHSIFIMNRAFPPTIAFQPYLPPPLSIPFCLASVAGMQLLYHPRDEICLGFGVHKFPWIAEFNYNKGSGQFSIACRLLSVN